jgi:putative nucleotidyltransferase with HDIG domain
MLDNNPVLLISDRPDRGRELADRLRGIFACRAVGLYEEDIITEPAAAVITDVGLCHGPSIERLRHLLSQPRVSATPIVAILQSGSHLERVQAAALGATSAVSANISPFDLAALLAPVLRHAENSGKPGIRLKTTANAERARQQFRTIFSGVARGELVSKTIVDDAVTSVMTALGDGEIRRWLEIVLTYDDATYQHCLLVTGLAAGFASDLQFSNDDQKRMVRGALLHDIGKARIPHAILNKPAALTEAEMAIMRTHPSLGYQILRNQGDYDREVLDVVLQHHELLDGSGYPAGLAGAEIGDLVRLVTICDIYAALVERRPYRPALEPLQAFKVLQQMENRLEGALVRAFERIAQQLAMTVNHSSHL